jgi:hypothetical protein
MKKLLITIFCLFAVPAMAAWTPTLTACDGQPFAWGGGGYMFCYELSATSDAGSSGDTLLSTMMTTAFGKQESEKRMRQLAGTALFWVDYVPDGTDTPETASTITIDKETSALIFSVVVATAGTAESWRGDIDTGTVVPLTDLTIAMTTFTNTKIAVIKLWFYGGNK